MSVRPSPGDWAGRGGGGAGGGGGGGRAQGGVRVCASDSVDPSGGCLHPSGWGPAQPGRPRRLPLPSLTLPPRVPASTYPASPGRLAERAAPASCDCPELVPGARGEPGAEPRGAGARAGAQRERLPSRAAPRPPHARPSPSPSPAAAAAARTRALTLLHSRGSRQRGSGPLFLSCSAQHRASKSKSPLPHLSFSPDSRCPPLWCIWFHYFSSCGVPSEGVGVLSERVGVQRGGRGLGKCNSFSQPGVGAKREATGRSPPGSAVESVGLGETSVWIWGCGRTRPGSSHRGPGEGAGGGSPVWSPGRRPPARERVSERFPPKPQKSQCSPHVATLCGER